MASRWRRFPIVDVVWKIHFRIWYQMILKLKIFARTNSAILMWFFMCVWRQIFNLLMLFLYCWCTRMHQSLLRPLLKKNLKTYWHRQRIKNHFETSSSLCSANVSVTLQFESYLMVWSKNRIKMTRGGWWMHRNNDNESSKLD